MATRFDLRVIPTVLLAWAATAWSQQPAPETLGQYIPGDVWAYVRAQDTPSRQFLKPHFDRVFRALRESGIEQEFARVLSLNMPPAERAEFDRTWAEVSKAFRSIQWCDLLGSEVAFAERFGGLMPEIFVLSRPAPEADASVEAFANLMRHLASLAKDDAAFRHETRDGVETWSVESANAPVGAYLMRKGPVLALVIGKQAMEECRAFLAGRGKGRSIEQSPRFRAALKEVPAGEYAQSFVDVHELLQVLDRLPDRMLGEVRIRKEAEASAEGAAPEPAGSNSVASDVDVDTTTVDTLRRVFHSITTHLGFVDYVVTTSRMDGRREVTTSVTRLRRGGMDLPCCTMVTQRTPFRDVHRYIPKEATGFMATTFIDPSTLYRTALDIIRKDIPDGENIVARWAALQTSWNFHVEDDLLGWISGELLVVEMPSAVPNPYGEGDSVCLMRVRDPAKAQAKLRAGLDRAAKFLTEKGQPIVVQNPQTLPAEQFQLVAHPWTMMMDFQPCVGVWEGWLVLGSREQAIQTVIATSAGRHPSILENPRYSAEGLKLQDKVFGASFTDLSNLGQELSQVFIGMGFAAAMLPNEPQTRTIQAVINSLSRLGPVVAELNFFSSQSTQTTYADGAFTTTTVITYKPDSKP